MADITSIKRGLTARVRAVAEHLLPKGRKEGNEWRVGSLDGEQGKSLGVHLEGQKAGVWADFKTGECGDLIDLWAQVRNIPISEALGEARSWLGIERPHPYREPQRAYVRPPKPACVAPKARVKDYLVEERNIPAQILTKYNIGEQGDLIIFPFLSPKGDLVMAKSRPAAAGAPTKPTASGCEPILFGWQAIDPSARSVVITEGEIDALSWAAYGYPALSVPFGGGKGGKQQWIENEFERMERFEKIYIATDMDDPGHEAADEIAARLGRHRCYRVIMPHKDGNECLVQGVPKAEMDLAIKTAPSLDPSELKRPSDYAQAVMQLFYPEDGSHLGYQTPYPRLRNKLLFRPGEVTLWSGASGAGKSQILSDCAVDWIKQGSRICVSSLEMHPSQTLRRMVKQVGGLGNPSREAIEASLTWLDERENGGGLLIYDLVGKVSIQAILDVFDYARGKYGCDQFMIDSLMRLGVAADDHSGQEKAVYQLVDWTVSSRIHLHLVAHARKGSGEGAHTPDTEDVKGAMEIGANAFNILTVWRNRKQEEQIARAILANDAAKLAELQAKPGVILNVAKQRNGDFEGKVGLWFDQDSYRYRSSQDRNDGRTYLDIYNLKGGENDQR